MIRRALLSLSLAAFSMSAHGDEAVIRAAFPNTAIQTVDCALAAPLCEVVAGKSDAAAHAPRSPTGRGQFVRGSTGHAPRHIGRL